MRKKHSILRDVRDDIRDLATQQDSPLWVQYRHIEVLIDIRDVLSNLSHSIESALVYLDKEH